MGPMSEQPRNYSPLDRFIGRLDRRARDLLQPPDHSPRPSPAANVEGGTLDADSQRHVARLMRVNHAGEIAAQALYRGQAAAARHHRARNALQDAAAEEADHLTWCEARLRELDSQASLLSPLWYAGSWTIGAAAGLAGDKWSLGFVAETERQVVQHLDTHLARLPAQDMRSRAVLTQMREDELRHGEHAVAAGGRDLPALVRTLMRACGKVMTRTAYWI